MHLPLFQLKRIVAAGLGLLAVSIVISFDRDEAICCYAMIALVGKVLQRRLSAPHQELKPS